MKQSQKVLIALALVFVLAFAGLGLFTIVPEAAKVIPNDDSEEDIIPDEDYIAINAHWEVTQWYADGTSDSWVEGETSFQLLDIFYEGKKLDYLVYEMVAEVPNTGVWTSQAVIGVTLIDQQTSVIHTIVPSTENNRMKGIVDAVTIQNVIPPSYRMEGGEGRFLLVITGWLEGTGEDKEYAVNMAEVKIPLTYEYISRDTSNVNTDPPASEGGSTPTTTRIIRVLGGIAGTPEVITLRFSDWQGESFTMEAYTEPWDSTYGYTIHAVGLDGNIGYINNAQVNVWETYITPP